MDCIIYKIEDNTDHKLYIGSTTQSLKTRLSKHKSCKKCSCYEIIENGDYIIAEIERCDSENRKYREQFWIDNTNCINKRPAFVAENKKEYDKIRYKEKGDKLKKQKKELYHYQNSWGGDARNSNNLLSISLDIFM